MTDSTDIFIARQTLESDVRVHFEAIRDLISNAVADGIYPDGLTVHVDHASKSASFLSQVLYREPVVMPVMASPVTRETEDDAGDE